MHLRLKRQPSKDRHYNDQTIAIVAVESYRSPDHEKPRQRYVAYLGSITPPGGWWHQGGSLASHLKVGDRRKLWKEVVEKLDELEVTGMTRDRMERWLDARIPRPRHLRGAED